MRSYMISKGSADRIGKIAWVIMLALVILLLPGENKNILHAEGLEYGRFRITPELSLVGRYSDNIYLEPADREGDFYTEISPEITLDFALAPRNYITLNYIGNFYRFSSADNFNNEHHRGELSWSLETVKGSTFRLGTSISESSVQPYSPDGISRDFSLQTFFGGTSLMVGAATELGAAYERTARRFDEIVHREDDFDRDRVDLSAVFGRHRVWPLLLQYRYIRQDNVEFLGFNRDFETHAIYTGARWHPAGKLSGALRIGYLWSDFENPQINDYSGLGMDIDVIYDITDITRVTLIGRRFLMPVTIAERDTGSYFIFTSAGIRLAHHRWERIVTRLNYYYNYRDYQPGPLQLGARIDREHVVELNAEYVMREWVSFIAVYRYRNNDSDLDRVDFRENLFHLGISLSI